MADLFYLVGWNQVLAVVMGLAVWAVCRSPMLRRRPAVCHGLWLLVLLKLVTPPVLPVPVLPAIAAEENSAAVVTPVVALADRRFDLCCDPAAARRAAGLSAAGSGSTNAISDAVSSYVCPSTGKAEASTSFSVSEAVRGASHFVWHNLYLVVPIASLLITGLIWLAAARRLIYVRRLLRGGAVESGRAAALMRDVARQFDLRCPLKLQIVDTRISPMLWAMPGSASIILPRQLVESLHDAGVRSILAHEVAHYVRRDHWTSTFTFLVVSLLWWNPLAWFARRRMAAAAEVCCDALALERIRGSRKVYAATLLTVVDSLTWRTPGLSAFGIAFGGSHSLRRRFELIADANVKSRMTRKGWALVAVGMVCLALMPVRAEVQKAEDVSTKALVAAPEAKADKTVVLHGKVFGPDGNPVADARLFLNLDEWHDSVELGKTGSDGVYRFEVPEKQLVRTVAASFTYNDKRASLLVVADDLGAGWIELLDKSGGRYGDFKPDYAHDFQLRSDLPVTGQIVDADGKPVAGARVSVRHIHDIDDRRWFKMPKGIAANDPGVMTAQEIDVGNWFSPLYPTAWPSLLEAKSDADGRFKLTGLGKNRAVVLDVTGPGIKQQTLFVLTRDDVAAFAKATRAKFPEVRMYDALPTLEVERIRTIAGTVRDATTGEPVSGVRVVVNGVYDQTDRLGRYRMERGGEGKFRIEVTSDDDQYVNIAEENDGKEVSGEVSVDFKLPRGVVVSGQVVEAGTDRPIPSGQRRACHDIDGGPLVAGYVEYVPLASNEVLRGTSMGGYFAAFPEWKMAAMIDGDGRFKLAVPPGPGVFMVRAQPGMPEFAELSVSKSEDGLHRLFPFANLDQRFEGDGAPGGDEKNLAGFAKLVPVDKYVAYRVIDPAADAKNLDVKIAVARGPSRLVRFVDEDRKAIHGVIVRGLSNRHFTVTLDEPETEAFALSPSESRELSAISNDGKHIGMTKIRGNDLTPAVMTLQRAGTVSGRLVDKAGKPLAGYMAIVHYSDAMDFEILRASLPKTDADGRFTLDGVMPGEKATIYFQKSDLKPGEGPQEYRPEAVRGLELGVGEVREVGEISEKVNS